MNDRLGWLLASFESTAYREWLSDENDVYDIVFADYQPTAPSQSMGLTSMSKKLLAKVIAGSKNIRFAEMIRLVEAFGFRLSRVNGSHHIFVHPDIRELVNIQDVNGQAKPYQIQQFLKLVERYDLKLEDE